MTPEELISGLQSLIDESKVAKATIQYSYDIDRIKRRMTELEDENTKIKQLLKTIYAKLTENQNMHQV